MCNGQLPPLLTVTPERRAVRIEAGEGRGSHGLRLLSLRMQADMPFRTSTPAGHEARLLCAVLNISQLWEAAPASAGQGAARLRVVGLLEDGRRW